LRSSSTRIAATLGLFLAACLVALAGAEMAVRVFAPHARDHVLPGGLLEMDEDLGWRLTPGRVGVHRSRYFEVEYRSNALGFRDAERARRKSPDVYRVLVYGDSQVFGWGVPAERRFTNLLENRTESLELWNLAVPGYGLGQQVVAFETRGHALGGDEVVFLVSPWTLLRVPFAHIFRKPKPRFRLDEGGRLRLDPVDTRSRVVSGRLYALLSRFYLPYFLDRRLQALRRPRRPEGPRARTLGGLFDERAGRILLRAQGVARRRGQRVRLLASFPEPGVPAELERFGAEHGMDVLPIVLDPTDRSLIFGPHDPHWNTRGHARVAAQLEGPWLGQLVEADRLR
jgi:hypothetical protein